MQYGAYNTKNAEPRMGFNMKNAYDCFGIRPLQGRLL
jgi:hypothetical protein